MQDDSASDPFDLLGVPARFDLPGPVLQRAWLARTAALHPDRAGGDAEAAGALARLNRAKATLENPEERANALLARLGGAAKDADKSLPDGFLAEMLETREEIESAVASGDAAEREKWSDWAELERERYTREVGELFARVGEPAKIEVMKEIRRTLNAWRYIERLIEQLHEG